MTKKVGGEKRTEGMVENNVNITERKRAEDALRESNERYYALFNRSLDMVYIHDFKGNFLDANDVTLNTLGYSRSEIKSINFSTLVNGDDLKKAFTTLKKTENGINKDVTEYKLKCKDGSYIFIEARGSVIYKDGKPFAAQGIARDITKRKQAEIALLETKDMLERVGRMAIVGGWEKNFITGEDYWSEMTKKIHEVEPDFIPTMENGIEFYEEGESRKKIIKAVTHTIETGEPFDVELQIITAKGNERWVRSIGNAEFKDGKCYRLFGTFQDIDVRKKAIDTLLESEKRLNNFLNNLEDIAYEVSIDGVVLRCNPITAIIVGIPVEEIIGHPFVPLFTEESGKIAVHNNNKTLQGESREFEATFKSGRICHFNNIPMRDDNGNIVGTFGIARDITNRKQAEKNLIETEGKFQTTFQSNPAVMTLTELATGKIVDANKAFQKASGYSEEELIGKTTKDIGWIKQKDREKFKNIMIETDGSLQNMEVPVYNKKGEKLTMLTSAEMIFVDGVEHFITSAIDITESKKMWEAMVQSEKMMTVGGLAAGMAHEINNPLGSIIQNTELIHNRIFKDYPINIDTAEKNNTTIDAVRKYMIDRDLVASLQNIEIAGKRASKIISGMLDFSRKSNDIYANVYDLADLMDKSIDLVSQDYKLKKDYDFRSINIIREYDDCVRVPCNPTRIEQVFVNILKNGAEAMFRRPGVDSQLTLRIKLSDKMGCVEIEDNGPGMAHDIRKRIFEPFFTTKDVGEGIGLGLSVSYFIITENHNGTMYVESMPDERTKFTICLPVVSGEHKNGQ